MKGSSAKSKVASSGRPKCQLPVGLETRFCHALDKVIFGYNEHIYIVQVMNFLTMKEWVAGVAGRKDSQSRLIMFNRCPFCGEKILFQRPASVDKPWTPAEKKAQDRQLGRLLIAAARKITKARRAA